MIGKGSLGLKNAEINGVEVESVAKAGSWMTTGRRFEGEKV
jgi:hypothetical protein